MHFHHLIQLDNHALISDSNTKQVVLNCVMVLIIMTCYCESRCMFRFYSFQHTFVKRTKKTHEEVLMVWFLVLPGCQGQIVSDLFNNNLSNHEHASSKYLASIQ